MNESMTTENPLTIEPGALLADVPEPDTRGEREDPAVYPIDAGNEDRADEVICQSCGHAAIEHARGKDSIYGLCPAPAVAEGTDVDG